MAGRLIGDAWISILADTDRFRASADAGVKKAIAGMRAKIPVDADTGPAEKQVAALAAALKKLDGKVNIDARDAIKDISDLYVALETLRERAGDIKLDMDDSKGLAKLHGVLGTVDDLLKKLEDVEEKGIDFNIEKGIAALYRTRAIVESLEQAAENMRADFDVREAVEKLKLLGGGVGKISDELSTLRASVSDSQFLAKVISMQAQALKLAQRLEDMPVTANTLPFEADLFKLAAQVEAFKKSLEISPSFGGSVYKPTGAPILSGQPEHQLMALGTDLAKLATESYAARASQIAFLDATKNSGAVATAAASGLAFFNRQQSMIVQKGGLWGFMSNQIRLFGGALDKVLPSWARTIGLWHLGLDVIAEFAAAWTPALIALGAFSVAAIPTGKAIFQQWKSINTVIDSIGGQGLPDTAKGFDSVAKAVRPSVMVLWGEALAAAGTSTGKMGSALTDVGRVFDAWGARISAWVRSGAGGFSNVIRSGARDLAGLGEGFYQLGRILSVLFHVFPGYVHVLLNVGDALLRVTADAMGWLYWPIKAALYIHGFLIYVGLAATAVIALGRAMAAGALIAFVNRMGAGGVVAAEASGKFSKFGMVLGGFIGTVAAGAVNGLKFTGAVIKTGREAGIAAAGAKLLKGAISIIPFGAAGLAAAGAAIAIGGLLYLALRKSTDAAQAFGQAMQSSVAGSSPLNLQKNIASAIGATNIKLAQQQRILAGATATGAPQGGVVGREGMAWQAHLKGLKSVSMEYQSALAGIGRTSITAAHNQLEVFKATGSVGVAMQIASALGIKWSDVNKASAKQLQIIIAEMQAYAAATNYLGLSQSKASANVGVLNVAASDQLSNVQKLNSAWDTYLGILQGGEKAFVPLQQAIGQYNTDLQKSHANMTSINPASLTLRNDFLSVASAAESQVSALESYVAVTSGANAANKKLASQGIKDVIAELIPLAGHNATARASIIALAQRADSSITTWQAVTRWIGNRGAAQAAVQLNSINGKLATSIQNVTAVANNLDSALQGLVAQMQDKLLLTLDGATGKLNAFGSAIVNSNGKLTALVQTTAIAYYNALVKAGMSTQQATQYTLDFGRRAGLTGSAVNALGGQLGYLSSQHNTVASKTAATTKAHKHLQDQLDKARASSDKLWGSLHTLAGGSPYNAIENTTFKGSGSITAKANIPGQPNLTSHLNFLPHFAGGGTVPGFGNADSQLIAATPGELVVPKAYAPQHAAALRSRGVPGFAGGGVVGGETAALGREIPWSVNMGTQFAAETAKAFVAGLKNSVTTSAAGAMGGVGTVPAGAAGNGLLIARFLMSAGLNAAAAAGVAATIFGESSWSPEAVGSGGFGLIGWTGNTIGLPPGYTGPTGNVAQDMAIQLRGVMGYINANGGIGPLNSAGNPVSAGDVFSAKYERPLVMFSDTRPAIADQLYAELLGGAGAAQAVQTQKRVLGRVGRNRPHSGGGVINEPVLGTGLWSGVPYSFAENGQPEVVSKVGQASPVHQGVPGATQIGQQTIIGQNNMLIKLLQQMPYAFAAAMSNGAGKGALHGYFGAQF